jgi:ERCC4-type nuclease
MKFTIIQDSREQRPLPFSDDVPVVIAGLRAGDYSILGMETDVALERKNIDDLCMCVTSERDRFERELVLLRGYKWHSH